jgi:hypothetical protein
MPGLGFLGKYVALFMPGEKHSHCVGSRSSGHSVDPDGQMPAVNHYQLEITLLSRTKSSTRGIDNFTNTHLFRPETFTIDHHGVLLEALARKFVWRSLILRISDTFQSISATVLFFLMLSYSKCYHIL